MHDENFTSNEWEQLWKDLDTVKDIPSWHEQNKETKMHVTKNIKASDFGIGASMFGKYKDPVQGLSAEIRGGAGHIELSPDAVSGGRMSFGKITNEQRRALRELKEVNDVTISTHAHPGVTGLTGFNAERYSFEEQGRQQGIDEVKKAIDFAADVAQRGSITFHAGDFARPLAGQFMGGGENDEFQMSPDELNQMVFAVIDDETKRYAEGGIFRADQKVVAPIFNYNTEMEISGTKGKHYMPEFETNIDGTVKTNEFKTFKEYAAWLVQNDSEFKKSLKNKEFQELYLKGKSAEDYIVKGKYKGDKIEEINNYYILEKAAEKKFKDDQKIKIIDSINNLSRSLNTTEGDLIDVQNALNKAQKLANEGDCYLVNDGKHLLAIKSLEEARRIGLELNEEDVKSEIDWKKGNYAMKIQKGTTLDQIKEKDLNFGMFYAGDVHSKNVDTRRKEIDLTRETQIKQIEQQLEKIDGKNGHKEYFSMSEYAQEQNKKSFEELGLELNERNEALEKQSRQKGKKFERMFFAIENLFPEKYGAHPDELLHVIDQAREAMTKGLIDHKNMTKAQAEKIAKESIKATFDTGHLHMWRKYFKREKGESEETFDKRFDSWALSQTKKLVESGVIGNIHIADNFGYDDDHLTIGQGKVPIAEYMKMFDKAVGEGKITGKISVEGFDETGQHHGVHEAWKTTAASIFHSNAATERWTDVTFSEERGGYFTSGGYHGGTFASMQNSSTGLYNKPSFVFGRYSPDREEWAPWSDTTLE